MVEMESWVHISDSIIESGDCNGMSYGEHKENVLKLIYNIL